MLKIETEFANPYASFFYRQALEATLGRLLPPSLLVDSWSDSDLRDEEIERWASQLPIVIHEPLPQNPPYYVTLYCLWRLKAHAFRFTFDLVSRWLCPHMRTNIKALFAVDFRLPDISDELYTFCQIDIALAHHQEVVEVSRSLPIIMTELRLGIESRDYSWRILEVKGLHVDDKAALIQEQISYLIKRKPHDFDQGLITEMQHMLVMSRDDFLALRDSRHLSRVITAQYLFRHQLYKMVERDNQQRYLKLKIYRTKLRDGEKGSRSVLGILVAINFIGAQEVFEERHLMKAVTSYLSGVRSVEGSCFTNRRSTEQVSTLYLEVEKESGGEFSVQEVALLRAELPYDLKDRIEHLLHPVFMPRNEEEILRNILNLSNQIKYSGDPAQAFIAFEEQMRDSLTFTVILVRVGTPGEISIQEKMTAAQTPLEYLHDRCKMIGMLRKKYTKEAHVFRLKFAKENFIRLDGSIDLNKARQLVVDELSRIIGEFRDYNGGMISKQNELLCAVRGCLDGKVKYNELLLENFFYALMPVEMRTLLEASTLARLFQLLLEVIDEGLFKSETLLFRSCCHGSALLLIISAPSLKAQEDFLNLGHHLQVEPGELAYSFVQVYDIPYFCYILRGLSESQQEDCLNIIQEQLASYSVAC